MTETNRLTTDDPGPCVNPECTAEDVCYCPRVPALHTERVAWALSTGPTLDDRLTRYLDARGLTSLATTAEDQVQYVVKEADELREAIEECHSATAVRHEIADVANTLTLLARILGTTVEACIVEKTEADRGRG